MHARILLALGVQSMLFVLLGFFGGLPWLVLLGVVFALGGLAVWALAAYRVGCSR